MHKPLEQLTQWHREAIAANEADPHAMTVATHSAGGSLAARVVLLRGIDDRGIRFFTNYRSRKGRELIANPSCAVVLYWPLLARQVRLEGRAERLEPEASDAYFAQRPRGHQLGAWASEQSEEIASLDEVDARYRALEAEHAGREVPRPPHWGGFRIVPLRVEFWQGRDNRLHERVEFTRANEGAAWRVRNLSP